MLEPRQPIAIVRLDDLSTAVELSRALVEGGIRAIEFTLTNPDAVDALGRVRQELGGDAALGVGTVLTPEAAETAARGGAEFIVTPVYRRAVVEQAKHDGIPIVCGAFTPTEILDAWESGADMVKVFPAGVVGPSYIKDVLAPLPGIPLVPTSGVNLDNCAAFIAAGAFTVAVGSSLVDKRLVATRDWPALADLAGQYVEACAGAVPSTR